GTMSSQHISFEPMSVDSISSWPAPEDSGELTLDLADSVPPPGEASSAPPPSIPPPPSLPDSNTGIRMRAPISVEPDHAPPEPEPEPAPVPRASSEPPHTARYPEPDLAQPPNGRPLSFGPASGD